MERIRQFLNSAGGKGALVLLFVVGGVLIWFQMGRSFGDGGVSDMSEGQYFVDSSTGMPFRHTLKAGERVPIAAPSGGNTGYPAELCYWNADGTPKADPTPVLLAESAGKSGPTFCPDCGRLVKSRNPTPTDSDGPPPTRAEFEDKKN